MSNIATTIQNMKSDKYQARYFFSKAHNYQNLHLWLKPLFDNGLLFLNEERGFQHWQSVFLEKVSIQNKENEKSEITQQLLSIANQTIEHTTDDHMVWYMIKVIFNLPFKNITLEHIDFINSHIRGCKYRSILNHDITETVIPVLVENNRQKHMLKLLPLIFGYNLKKNTLSHVEPISIIEEYNLQELLKRHSKDIIKLVGLDGLEIVVNLIKDITTQEKSIFNPVWLTVIRTKTDDEIKQNQHSNRYDNQLIFFILDLLESLPSNEIKPYIEDFLLKQQHLIFIRIALHIINCKYNDLKDIFWQWMDANVKYEVKELELWTLLKDSSGNFTSDEFNKIIDWIEASDCRKYRPNDSDKAIELCNAYKRKEWLLCLKDNNERAEKLYQEYHLINDYEAEHPGFSYWSSGIYSVPEYSYPDKEAFCKNPTDIIKNFDPSKIKKEKFRTDKDLIEGLANDLSIYITNNPETFTEKIDEFKNLEYVYKDKIIQGLSNAWKNKKEFDWDSVFDFILNELSSDCFDADKNQKKWFVSEVAGLIECGTTKDDNAFDKTYLPKAKTILLKLLDNKYREIETETYNSLISHVLNSTNGKVLHSLIHYALRYGRLNSSQSVKWEDDIKKFFTEQLKENNIYSRSVFTILGRYFHNLQFLDKQWVFDNFNKIFPLENEQLWKASINAYFFYTNTVYEETYNLFKKHKHIEKILSSDMTNDTKSRLVAFTCIAYINDIDNQTILDIVDSKNQDNVLNIISSMFDIYGKETSETKKEKIKAVWYRIYEVHKDTQKIFEMLATNWFVFLDKISDKDMELLEYTIKHIKEEYQSYRTIKEMARLSVNHQEEIAKLYNIMFDHNIYPTYAKVDIKKILDNLNPEDKLKIENRYRKKGIYDIND